MNNTFGINGAGHTPETALELARLIASNKFASEDEKDLFQFLTEWFDATPTISVNTSGSTGKPKTMLLDKERVKHSAQQTVDFFQLKRGMDVLLCLNTNYIAGKIMVVRAVEHGMNIITKGVSARPIKNEQQQYHFAAMVPMQVEQSLNDLKHIDSLIIGGAPISPTLEEQLQHIETACWATYGMTETITHVALKKLNGLDKSTVFTALPHVAFTTDERSCLCIVAPFLNDEPVQTNDIVELIDEKHFKWLGRHDFVINSGGVKLFPEQIEKKLTAHIKGNFIVASLPDATLGSKAVLICEEIQAQLTLENMKKYLDKYEVPHAVYMGKLQRTATGKIDRRATQEKLSEMHQMELK